MVREQDLAFYGGFLLKGLETIFIIFIHQSLS